MLIEAWRIWRLGGRQTVQTFYCSRLRYFSSLPHGLPPDILETDFRETFAKKGTVTDARLIPHRRFGYIGYKSPEEAATAVRYFDKSYIRTSKIGVEIARPVAEKYGTKVASKAKPEPTKVDMGAPKSLGKRKRHVDIELQPDDPKREKKFEEFLNSYAPASKSQTWNNPGLPDEFSEMASKDGSALETLADDAQLEPKRPEPLIQQDVEDVAMGDTVDIDGTTSNNRLLSDAEWLRSKQSRTLELTDDVDTRLTLADAKQTIILAKPAKDPPEQDTGQQSQNSETAVQVHSEVEEAAEKVRATGRLFLRNLPYSATEDDIRSHFSGFGALKEVHLSLDAKTNNSKGFAYVMFENPANAVKAHTELDGIEFQGRLLHILPANAKRESKLDEFALKKLPLKKQRELQRKAGAATTQFNWNSMYMNADAIMSSVASRLGVSKAELLNPTSSDAAVRQAHAETHILQETKAYLEKKGVNLRAFESIAKDDRILLLKNFPFGTTSEELRALLTAHGELSRLLIPPAGTIALAEFKSAPSGRSAFAALAYRRFKDGILFLEKGPQQLFTSAPTDEATDAPISTPAPSLLDPKSSAQDLRGLDNEGRRDVATLFVRNLNFTTTAERLTSAFRSFEGFIWARIKTKPNKKELSSPLSMGFGFVGFATGPQAEKALKAMDGQLLEGHKLQVKVAHAGAGEHDRYPKKTAEAIHKKIIIKNLPFEITKKDVMTLFGKYGTLRTVRLPKKFGNRTRGFAFAEFVTAKDATNAMQALRDTHLLGRRLVLDYAQEDAQNAEEEIERLSKKVSKQMDTTTLARLKLRSKAAINLDETGAVDDYD